MKLDPDALAKTVRLATHTCVRGDVDDLLAVAKLLEDLSKRKLAMRAIWHLTDDTPALSDALKTWPDATIEMVR